MQTRSIAYPWTTVFAISTDAVFIPVSAWMSSTGFDSVRCYWEIAAITGLIELTPAWQVANNEDVPGATQTVTTTSPYKDTVDVYYPEGWRDAAGDATAPTKSNVLIRFGFLARLKSGSTLALARATAIVEAKGC